jgi:hypothetical protein
MLPRLVLLFLDHALKILSHMCDREGNEGLSQLNSYE